MSKPFKIVFVDEVTDFGDMTPGMREYLIEEIKKRKEKAREDEESN